MLPDGTDAAHLQITLGIARAQGSESLEADRDRGITECNMLACHRQLTQPETERESRLPGEDNLSTESEKISVQLDILKKHPENSHEIFIHNIHNQYG